jgi:adenylate cyclase
MTNAPIKLATNPASQVAIDATARMAVMFADIAGSTSLYERLGDRAALAHISISLERLADATRKVGGRVVKTIGDEVMCVFSSAGDAVRAATDMQLAQSTAQDGLGLRVGFHCGEVIQRDGDVFGDSVNVAARVASLANAGQILLTADTLQQLPPYLRSGARAIGPVGVRGKELPLALCEIIWQWADDMTMMAPVQGRDDAPAGRRLVVEYRGRQHDWSESDGALRFGRDAANDIVVDHPRASRLHGRIEIRQSGFVVVDLSSNGTYVQQESGGEIVLRREEVLIQGVGEIGPGDRVPALSGATIRFRCL